MPKDYYRFELRRTKIKRRCGNCSKIIVKKQTYYRGVGRSNGVFSVQVLCCACGAEEQHRKEEISDKNQQGEHHVFKDYLQL